MSCRETRAGTLALRVARAYSQLPDKDLQRLFHALKREGADLPAPSATERDAWHARMRSLIQHSTLSERKKLASERDLFHSLTENHDPATFYALNLVERRARQAAVIHALGGSAVDLAAPGSQRDAYDIGPDGRPTRLWYASYGSNLSRTRFLTYIEGGRAPGSRSTHMGCRDATPPADDIAIRYSGALHFAYQSGRWDGQGVGFLDETRTSQALGRAYSITSEQFDDVVAQENGGRRTGKPVPLTDVLDNGHAATTTGLYSNLVHIGDYHNAPVITFTGSFSAQDALAGAHEKNPAYHARNEPSRNYLRMLGSGLHGTFGMTKGQQADYLRGCPGMENYNRRELLRVLRSPMEKPKPRISTPPPRPERLAAFDDAWFTGASRYSSDADMDAAADRWATEISTSQDTGEWRGDDFVPRPRSKGCIVCSGAHSLHDCPQLGYH